MADIFISYARADQESAGHLARLLESAGHAVWWDRHIRGGASYAKDIEKELKEARLVLVLWSAEACQSDWVNDEAVFARDRHLLLPVSLDGTEQPLGFRQYQAIDFKGWKGDDAAPPAHALLEAVAERLHSPAPPPAPTPAPAWMSRIRNRPYAAAGAGLALLVMLVAAAFAVMRTGRAAPDAAAAQKLAAAQELSVAVLPFMDMSAEGDQGYFADGISEELLNVLVRVDGLKVASRTSAFALKNEALSIGDIGRRLGVNYVVEGSVRKSDSDVRITAQLIEVANDRHLWSETFDRRLSDIIRVQEEISTAIVVALRSELGLKDAVNIEIKAATSNVTAFDLYLKARELYYVRARGRDTVKKSVRLSEEAVTLDPDFAKGWEQLAAIYAVAPSYGLTDQDYAALAMDAAARALKLDPNLSMPYAVMGLAYRTHYPTPWAVSLDNLLKAVERDDKNTSAFLWLGMDYVALGRYDEAIDALTKCLDIDPAYSNCRKNRSFAYLFKGEDDLALKDAEQNAATGSLGDFDVYIPALLRRGERFFAIYISRHVNWREGFPHADFIAALEHPEAFDPKNWEKVKAWAEAIDYDIADQIPVVMAFRAYDAITADSFDNAYEHLWLPAFSDFRKSAKFKELARELGLLAYWREAGFPPQCRALEGEDFECD